MFRFHFHNYKSSFVSYWNEINQGEYYTYSVHRGDHFKINNHVCFDLYVMILNDAFLSSWIVMSIFKYQNLIQKLNHTTIFNRFLNVNIRFTFKFEEYYLSKVSSLLIKLNENQLATIHWAQMYFFIIKYDFNLLIFKLGEFLNTDLNVGDYKNYNTNTRFNWN